MRSQTKIILNYFYCFLYKTKYYKHSFKHSFFFLSWLKIQKNNLTTINNSRLEKTQLSITGKHNFVSITNASLNNAVIKINGTNNKIVLENGVRFTGEINIRGTNCLVKIGKESTFGGARIINVGMNNIVTIGDNCLFSDQIEIWASDTHSIYNENNTLINPEKPIIIGNHVWVGSRVIILKGVTLGDDSIIGMGALVTKNVESKSIHVGSPNHQLKNNIKWSLDYKTEE